MLHACERSRPDVQAQRAAWQVRQAQLDPEHTVVVDESFATRAMTRLYGRAPAGQRVYDAVPLEHWQVTTLLLALRPDGSQVAMSIPESVTGPVFQGFVDQVLVPGLQPGDVVLMDRLQAHKTGGVAEAIARAGACLEFWPPYSPEFCPADPCFAQIKTFLRQAKARTARALDTALAKALDRLTPKIVKNYFRRSGYRV